MKIDKNKITIIKQQRFRSKSQVNMTDDMVRVTLDMSRISWLMLKNEITKRDPYAIIDLLKEDSRKNEGSELTVEG